MVKKEIFRGTATAMITPFHEGEIDFDCLGRLIDIQITAGIDALVIGGTTAEAATLTDEERYRLFEFSAERIDGKTKLIFGTGTNDTRVAIKHSKFAKKVGCDGLLLVTPYYNKGTEGGTVTTQTNYIETGANQGVCYGANNIGGTVTTLTNYIQGGTVTSFYGGCRDGGTVTSLMNFVHIEVEKP